MQNQPLVSVLMPVYNCEKYVLEAVESILQQTYPNFELLVIDDCSIDATVDKIKSLNDDRIQLIVKPRNSGYTNSLNFGLQIAKGKYIARMDGDDISLPTRFEKQVAFLETNEDVVVCGTNFSIIDTNNLVKFPESHEDIKVGLLEECKIGHPTVMLRKSILELHQISYDKLMEPAEDYDLWVRLLVFGKLYNLQESLLQYRVHDMQVSSVRRKQQADTTKAIRFKLLTYLQSNITQQQKEVYLDVIDSNKKISFQEFLVFLDLKKNIIIVNEIGFFNKEKFIKYWTELESKFITYYFKSQTQTPYSIGNFKEYISVFKKIEKPFKFNELVKFSVKSFINYRV